MKKLENVHVVIYSKKMLKQAVDRLKNLNQTVQGKVFVDFECHDNDLLIFHNGTFKMVHCLPVNPCYEITLNNLCEMIIDLEGLKTKDSNGKWPEIIEVDKFADLKKAHAEGAVIQINNIYGGWADVVDNSDLWLATYEYRIKPEPKVKMGDQSRQARVEEVREFRIANRQALADKLSNYLPSNTE